MPFKRKIFSEITRSWESIEQHIIPASFTKSTILLIESNMEEISLGNVLSSH